MTAHQLAERLLKEPDLPVAMLVGMVAYEVDGLGVRPTLRSTTHNHYIPLGRDNVPEEAAEIVLLVTVIKNH